MAPAWFPMRGPVWLITNTTADRPILFSPKPYLRIRIQNIRERRYSPATTPVWFELWGARLYNTEVMLESLEGFIEPGSEEEGLVRRIDFSRLPRHVAVIMDGNGRWARQRNLPRIEGHRAGAKSVQELVETSTRLGIEYLTLYAFSKENWKRPQAEVSTLWKLMEEYLKKEDKTLIKNNIRLQVIGQIGALPESARGELKRVMELTKQNDRLTVVAALNYGGRAEIVDAVKKLAADPDFNPAELNEDLFSRYLYTAGIPDPDLLIRTSGELRISNFLLWQVAYAEIWITEKFWPDFRRRELLQAICDYQMRERRFGDIGERASRAWARKSRRTP